MEEGVGGEITQDGETALQSLVGFPWSRLCCANARLQLWDIGRRPLHLFPHRGFLLVGWGKLVALYRLTCISCRGWVGRDV
jgi:hypothetical protein